MWHGFHGLTRVLQYVRLFEPVKPFPDVMRRTFTLAAVDVFSSFIRLLSKDLKGVEGDTAGGMGTFPNLLGQDVSLMLFFFCTLAHRLSHIYINLDGYTMGQYHPYITYLVVGIDANILVQACWKLVTLMRAKGKKHEDSQAIVRSIFQGMLTFTSKWTFRPAFLIPFSNAALAA